MKILLINPYQEAGINPYHPPSISKATGIYPPLGLTYLAAVLRKDNFQVQILDINALRPHSSEIKKLISNSAADLVGISSMTFNWHSALALCRITREALPKAYITVGGPQLTAYPKECLSFPEIDFGIYGEGEFTLLEACQLLRESRSLEELANIPGIIFKNNGGVKINPAREWIQNLDQLPLPARDLLDTRKYHSLFTHIPFATLITSRGCPNRCTFCSRDFFGSKVRYRSAENIVEEIQQCISDYATAEFMFYDDTFAIDPKRTMKLCELILKNKIKTRFSIRTRVNLANRELFRLLKQAGCYKIHMGVESGSQHILEAMKKNITLEQIEKAFQMAKAEGLKTVGYFMLGYPEENAETIQATLDLSRKLPLDWADFSITTPVPCTELYKIALEQGYLKSDYWRDYTLGVNSQKPPHCTNAELTEERLENYIKEAYRGFYLRPSYFLKRLSAIKNLDDLKNSVKGFFALKALGSRN